jgi:hypothetical protein
VLALAFGVIFTLAWTQRRPEPVTFEYGTIVSLTGVVREDPYPMMITADSSGTTTWLLAGPNKRGADSLVRGFGGQMIMAEGTRIYRPGSTMLELHHLARAAGGLPMPEERELGRATLTGEVVDGKCWIGAMNPGHGPTHRLCALRCLRGGLPPLLAGRDSAGAAVAAVLTGPDGRRIDSVLLPLTAAQIRITGRLRSVGSVLVLEADPSTIERVIP